MRSAYLLIGALVASTACGQSTVDAPNIVDSSSYDVPSGGDSDSTGPQSKPASTPAVTGNPAPPDMVLAVNIGGQGTPTNEGPFVGEVDAKVVVSGGTHFVLANPPTPRTPADQGLGLVVIDGVWSYSQDMTVDTPVASGSYDVFLYVAEDTAPETFQLYLEGQEAGGQQNTGEPDTWHEIGPYAVTVSDGLLTLRATGGFRLTGLEIHTAN